MKKWQKRVIITVLVIAILAGAVCLIGIPISFTKYTPFEFEQIGNVYVSNSRGEVRLIIDSATIHNILMTVRGMHITKYVGGSYVGSAPWGLKIEDKTGTKKLRYVLGYSLRVCLEEGDLSVSKEYGVTSLPEHDEWNDVLEAAFATGETVSGPRR